MFTVEQATALTEKMKLNVRSLADLMQKAWEGRAWIPLGYKDAAEWLREAVGVSRSYSYHLIALTTMQSKMREVTGSSELILSSPSMRTITSHGFDRFLDEVTPKLTQSADANERVIAEHVKAVREKAKGKDNQLPASAASPSEPEAEVLIEAIRNATNLLPTADELQLLDRATALRLLEQLASAVTLLETAHLNARLAADLPHRNTPAGGVLEPLRPFYPWVGGKRRIARFVQNAFPGSFGSYHEPFLGGGALALRMMQEYPSKTFHLSDLNRELVNAWLAVKRSPEEFIALLAEHSARSDSDYFYNIRDMDRKGLLPYMSEAERGARFVYICKTAFSGMWIENSEGHCRSAYGAERPVTPATHIMGVSELLNSRKTHIRCASFEDGFDAVKAGDLVYLDPPYATDDDEGTGTFSAYVGGADVQKLQHEVRVYMNRLTSMGAYTLCSNANTSLTRELYRGWGSARTGIRYSISNGTTIKSEMLFAGPLVNSSA